MHVAAPSSIVFEMTDALVTSAVREDWLAVLREHAKPRDLVVIAASTCVFVLAVAKGAHWLWWLAGLPAAIVVVLLLGWLVIDLLRPRLARARLRHLPHRRVTVDVQPVGIAFGTATERLEVAWSEIAALKRRTHFWVVCLRSGAQIPLPVASLTVEAKAQLEAAVAGPVA